MHRILQDILWLSPAVLEAVIAANFFHRGWWRTHPAFWGFLIFGAVRTAWLFAIGNGAAHYARYFYSYWLSEVLACMLGFFAIAEVFRAAFSRRLGLQERGTTLFRFALIILLGAALLVAIESPGNDSNKMVAGIFVIKQAESLVSFGMVASLITFLFFLGIPWSNREIGIAAGFAIQGAAEVVTLTGRTHYGRIANVPLVWILLVAGLCQALVWSAYFLRSETADRSKSASGEFNHGVSTLVTELDRMSEQVGILEKRC